MRRELLKDRLIAAIVLYPGKACSIVDALSESLDSAMAARLGEHFVQDDYVAAYRSVGRRTDREQQIGHIGSVGFSLCELVRMPLLGVTLAAMRTPAKLARVSELHRFLEQGYTAFRATKKPQDFVSAIVAREMAILENLYAKKKNPFKLLKQ